MHSNRFSFLQHQPLRQPSQRFHFYMLCMHIFFTFLFCSSLFTFILFVYASGTCYICIQGRFDTAPLFFKLLALKTKWKWEKNRLWKQQNESRRGGRWRSRVGTRHRQREPERETERWIREKLLFSLGMSSMVCRWCSSYKIKSEKKAAPAYNQMASMIWICRVSQTENYDKDRGGYHFYATFLYFTTSHMTLGANWKHWLNLHTELTARTAFAWNELDTN